MGSLSCPICLALSGSPTRRAETRKPRKKYWENCAGWRRVAPSPPTSAQSWLQRWAIGTPRFVSSKRHISSVLAGRSGSPSSLCSMLCARGACSPRVHSCEPSTLARCSHTILLKLSVLESAFPTNGIHIVAAPRRNANPPAVGGNSKVPVHVNAHRSLTRELLRREACLAHSM